MILYHYRHNSTDRATILTAYTLQRDTIYIYVYIWTESMFELQ